MEIVEIWQNLEKNASQIMIFIIITDWIVDVDGLGSDEDTAVQRNFRKGILATDLNFHTNVRINCD